MYVCIYACMHTYIHTHIVLFQKTLSINMSCCKFWYQGSYLGQCSDAVYITFVRNHIITGENRNHVDLFMQNTLFPSIDQGTILHKMIIFDNYP